MLVNVPVADPGRLEGAEEVWRTVAEVELRLGRDGRVLLRASGTEPLVRVMVEASTDDEAEWAANRLRAAVQHALGAVPA